MTVKKSLKSPVMWLYVGGAILLIVAVFVWCFKISMDPERVFWATIENSLATRGITVQSEQETNGTKAEQLIRYSFGAQNLAHTETTLTQGPTIVKNETSATPTA